MIISISGKDTYRSKEKLHSIQALGLQKKAKQEVFDFDDSSPDAIEGILKNLQHSLHTGSLFVEKRLIIMRGIGSLSKPFYPQIKKTFQNIQDKEDIILLFYDTISLLKTHPLTKILDTMGAKIQEYAHLPELKSIAYIHQMAIQQGLDINREGIMYIVDYQKAEYKLAGEKDYARSKKSPFQIDFYHIEMIFNQLYNYLGNQKMSIDIIQKFLPSQTRYSVFSLAEYIYAKEHAKYLQALRWLQKEGIEGIGLYALFISQIKNALIIKLALEKKTSYEEYVKMHPYVLKMTIQNARLWNSDQIQDIYQYLVQGDYQIKFEGKDAFMVLEGLIRKING